MPELFPLDAVINYNLFMSYSTGANNIQQLLIVHRVNSLKRLKPEVRL